MKKGVGGFTIVELLVVIVVVGILATISIVAYGSTQAKSRDAIRYADAKSILKALELYKADRGYYPNWNQDSTWVTGASPSATSSASILVF
jgi:prepilin-type N-terminal cleavage/methylation domain-containing protein